MKKKYLLTARRLSLWHTILFLSCAQGPFLNPVLGMEKMLEVEEEARISPWYKEAWIKIEDVRKNNRTHLDLSNMIIGTMLLKSTLNIPECSTTLQMLHLDFNELGDWRAKLVADFLKLNPVLRDLWLRGNGIGDVGVGYLGESLCENTVLENLHLDFNIIGNEGVRSLTHVWQKNTTLKKITLQFNNIHQSDEIKEERKVLSNIGIIYVRRVGFTKDEAEAVKWYRLAADQGDAGAQFNLGVFYEHGTGVAKDEAEAVKWYRLAADQGNVEAQANLGGCYYQGIGVVQDQADGVKWYRLAADQGDAEALTILRLCYTSTMNVAKGEAEAVKWYLHAADQGHAWAKNKLGCIYGLVAQKKNKTHLSNFS